VSAWRRAAAVRRKRRLAGALSTDCLDPKQPRNAWTSPR
jgi:hypothetical protein